MMDAHSSQPTDSVRKGATEEPVENTPCTIGSGKPTDLNVNEDAHVDRRDEEKSFGQEHTPKHANKTMGGREESSPTSPGRSFPRDNGKPSNQKITPDRSEAMHSKAMAAPHPNYPIQEKTQYGHPQQRPPQGYYAAGEPAYAQYRSQQQPSQQHDPHYAARLRMMPQGGPQQVSPGGRHMGTAYHQPGYAPGYNMQARYPQESQGYRQQGQYAQPHAPRYDQAGYHGGPLGQYGAYNMQDRHGYGDGSTHPQYGQGLRPPYQGRPAQYAAPQTPPGHEYDPRYVDQHGNVSGVTRAVSSSFDRSIKSTENIKSGVIPGQGGPSYYSHQAPQALPPLQDGASAEASDDDSWRQLKQVASVDDNMIRARIAQQKAEKEKSSPQASKGTSPPSNSSSLTNSPTDGNEAKSKMAALDSLSSVASGQEPIDTVGLKDGKASKETGVSSSPGSSTQSLDLMKCHSGSSGLLHGFPGTHGRSLSGGSFQAHSDLLQLDSKRSLEDRGDADTKLGIAVDGGRLGPLEEPPSKKARVHGKEEDKTDSTKLPLPVECSPPNSVDGAKAPHEKRPTGRHNFDNSPAYMGGSFFERAPPYTYLIDSVPSKEYPALPPRPGSSSSTITPAGSVSMQIEGPIPSGDTNHREGVGTLPSWDIINAQDSFGAGSMMGGASAVLGGNFSFSQDYPMLSSSGSNLGNLGAPVPVGAPPPPHAKHGLHHGPPTSLAESRNQSFEGGHYHGSFGRTRSESMEMGYNVPGAGARPGVQPLFQEGYKQQYNGPFPPQAASWGTASSSNSTQQAYGATYSSQYRGGMPPSQYQATLHPGAFIGGAMMRNYSEDSAMRTSPPPPNARVAGFQPPPEFSAPHNPQLARRPPPAVYIMSSGAHSNQTDPTIAKNAAAGGVYGWSQDEDDRLTEVMKKYKNPRDWEPISKEHGCGKTPKECHERWIRYLKPGVRKGQWQDHEDAIVVDAVSSSSEQPFTRWSDLAQKLPGRVGKQIRDRWVNHLNPNINHMPFSREDDLMLWEGHKQYGKRWVEISSKLFKSSRSENHIKNRWYSASFKKFISNEFGPNAHSGGKEKITSSKGVSKKKASLKD